jgi:hypothetical protein
VSAHRHDWAMAAPIDPIRDPGGEIARVADANPKAATYACGCGATKYELWTNGHVNRYITRANGRLWRGRRRLVKGR